MEGRLAGTHARRLLIAALVALLLFLSWSRLADRGIYLPAPSSQAQPLQAPSSQAHSSVGFTSVRHLDEHYEKHGREFGQATRQEYLAMAQALRDIPAGGPILEAVRKDGVTTRFDRISGAFIAFNPDRTIRTFFKPNDGERYFHRQAERGSE
jgi:pyocin large subunit-like protein